MDTVWILGDQLNASIASLADRSPSDTRLLFVEAADLINSRPYHRQRLHFVLSSMRHFAAELQQRRWEVTRPNSPPDGSPRWNH